MVRRVAGDTDAGALRHSDDGESVASRPSRSLTATTLAIVAIGVALPVTPMATLLGFTGLPGSYLAFLIAVTGAYLVLVDIAKRQLARRLGL